MALDLSQMDINQFKQKFVNQRININKSINEYIMRLADIKEFVNCETFFHSKRQELLESIHEYMDLVLILQRELNLQKSKVLNGIVGESSSNFNFKSKEEKLILIDGDNLVTTLNEYIDLFNNQVMFCNESKKTIEGIIYNMKYRFEVQKYLGVC